MRHLLKMTEASQALIVLPSRDLQEDIAFFKSIGFLQDKIYPADNPIVSIMSGHSLTIQLDKDATNLPAVIHILTSAPELITQGGQTELSGPNGTKIKILPKKNIALVPPSQQKFEVNRLKQNSPWIVGRAGMLYRDLIPSRLGGAMIASHIHILNEGPVPDMVHYHNVKFQLIFCYRGWVKVLYEDQGEPITLYPGDCVIQPPEIRHRVVESGDGLQVIEIGVPASHMTSADHKMELPNKEFRPEREFDGQKFVYHKAGSGVWKPWRMEGYEFNDTGVTEATKGVANVIIVRPQAESVLYSSESTHDFDIHFAFLLRGNMELSVEGNEMCVLGEGDAFTLPSKTKYEYSNASKDLKLLEVSLPKVQ